MISEIVFIRKRPDSEVQYTFIIEGPRGEYHVYPAMEEWDTVRAAAEEFGLSNIPDEVPPVAPPPTQLTSETLWSRMSEDEADAVDAALREAGTRTYRIFNSVKIFHIANPEHVALLGVAATALGDRAEDVLAPEF